MVYFTSAAQKGLLNSELGCVVRVGVRLEPLSGFIHWPGVMWGRFCPTSCFGDTDEEMQGCAFDRVGLEPLFGLIAGWGHFGGECLSLPVVVAAGPGSEVMG